MYCARRSSVALPHNFFIWVQVSSLNAFYRVMKTFLPQAPKLTFFISDGILKVNKKRLFQLCEVVGHFDGFIYYNLYQI